MARTKKTARKVDPRPSLASMAAARVKMRKTNGSVEEDGKSKRLSQKFSVLREIRRAQKALTRCIPKFSFQRVVKDIVTSYKLGFLWQRTALDCLQVAAEDFLIEFFHDSYI